MEQGKEKKSDRGADRSSDELSNLPLLPLRDLIVFPHMMMPLFVGREKSINALEDAMNSRTDIVLAAQKDAKTNNPEPSEIGRASCRERV